MKQLLLSLLLLIVIAPHNTDQVFPPCDQNGENCAPERSGSGGATRYRGSGRNQQDTEKQP